LNLPRSLDGAKRNPGLTLLDPADSAPDFAALHPGYDLSFGGFAVSTLNLRNPSPATAIVTLRNGPRAGRYPMCDYSLEHVASRAASKGERLMSTRFANAMTKGFAGIGDPAVAVCLRPGTELAFDDTVEFEKNCLQTARTKVKVATFRQIDLDVRHTHHDALEFADGQIIRLASLVPGQLAVVLQLPHEASDAPVMREPEREALVEVASQ
jgi:hypothetical protein